MFAIQLVKNTLDVHGLHQDYLVLFHFLFFIEFVRRHWLIKLYKFQVYNSTYNTSSVYCAVCLPPQVKSPSITIYPSSILFYIFYSESVLFFFFNTFSVKYPYSSDSEKLQLYGEFLRTMDSSQFLSAVP